MHHAPSIAIVILVAGIVPSTLQLTSHAAAFLVFELSNTRNAAAWQSQTWLARSCAVVATWQIRWNDQATCTFRKISNSSRPTEEGSKLLATTVQSEFKSTTQEVCQSSYISNTFCTVCIPRADAEWMNLHLTFIFYGWVNRCTAVTSDRAIAGVYRYPGQLIGLRSAAWQRALSGRRGNSRPKASRN